jgi:hypothetical protein
MFMGAVRGIRNPDAHELFDALDAEEALETLAFASMLMRRLDEAPCSAIEVKTKETQRAEELQRPRLA